MRMQKQTKIRPKKGTKRNLHIEQLIPLMMNCREVAVLLLVATLADALPTPQPNDANSDLVFEESFGTESDIPTDDLSDTIIVSTTRESEQPTEGCEDGSGSGDGKGACTDTISGGENDSSSENGTSGNETSGTTKPNSNLIYNLPRTCYINKTFTILYTK